MACSLAGWLKRSHGGRIWLDPCSEPQESSYLLVLFLLLSSRAEKASGNRRIEPHRSRAVQSSPYNALIPIVALGSLTSSGSG